MQANTDTYKIKTNLFEKEKKISILPGKHEQIVIPPTRIMQISNGISIFKKTGLPQSSKGWGKEIPLK